MRTKEFKKLMQLYEINVYFKNSDVKRFLTEKYSVVNEFLNLYGGKYKEAKIPINSILYYTVNIF